MSQFASTLYPQTNPSNPILLEFRELHAATGNPLWVDAYLFSSGLVEDVDVHDGAHWEHAMTVLNLIVVTYRQASLSG